MIGLVCVTKNNRGYENDDKVVQVLIGIRFERELIFHALNIDPNEKRLVDCVDLQNGKLENETSITNGSAQVCSISPCVANKNFPLD